VPEARSSVGAAGTRVGWVAWVLLWAAAAVVETGVGAGEAGLARPLWARQSVGRPGRPGRPGKGGKGRKGHQGVISKEGQWQEEEP
jgi:hypothetical protein